MRADTKTVSIDAAPERLIAFLSNPENLPRWAVGFAKSVRRDGSRWVVTTSGGEMGVRIEADPESGVIDFFMCPAHPPFAKCMLRGTLPSFGQAAAPSGDFVELAAGYWHTCALRPDNSIACWGPGQPGDAASNANYGQSTVPPLP